jgi:hypothetical protein
MAFEMTLREALAIQARQVAWYADQCPDIGARVALKTDVTGFDLDAPMSVAEVNRYVPRGAAIEALMKGYAQ